MIKGEPQMFARNNWLLQQAFYFSLTTLIDLIQASNLLLFIAEDFRGPMLFRLRQFSVYNHSPNNDMFLLKKRNVIICVPLFFTNNQK